MKNVSIILNVVLLIAVVVLYVLFFSGGKAAKDSGATDTKVLDVDDLSIAYVNTDSVLNKYELFKKLSKDLEDKQKKAEQSLKSRAEGFQREMQDYQRSAGNLTINQAKALEENLRQKQQNLYMYEQSLTQELMQENNAMNEQLNQKLSEFLKKYGSEHNLELVLAYTNRGEVLFANDNLDITNNVVEGLNSEYNAEKSGGDLDKTKPDTVSTK